MNEAPITIEPMQAKYNPQVGRLLVHGFRGKFQRLAKLNDEELSLFFEKMLELYPYEPASQRVIALQEGVVLGTLSIKWKAAVKAKVKPVRQPSPSWKSFRQFGQWNVFKLGVGLYLMDHQPQVGECYIADLAVHPDCRGKGIGKRLLRWAQHFVQSEPGLQKLSLYVSERNPRAKGLYEQFSFRTRSGEYHPLWYLLFNEARWYYMVNDCGQGEFGAKRG
ncbi:MULTISPECIES: N-acetyltransferase [Paenibacillus]|uniref:GNAT family N-acetyltransferase n=1 Tax=Paenibacillus TaxID=44249 RepID=UPI002FDF63DD